MEVALGCLDLPRDRFIDFALTCTIRALKPSWAPALEQGRLTCEGNLNHLTHLLATDGNPDTASALERIIAGGKAPADQTGNLRILLIASGSPSQLTTAIKAGPLTPEIANALTTAIRSRGIRPDAPDQEIFAGWQFQQDSTDPIHLAMSRLAASLGLADSARHILTLTNSPSESLAAAAVAAWGEYRGPAAIPDLVRLAPEGRSSVRIAAITTLFTLAPEEARTATLKGIASRTFSPEDAASLVNAALASQGSPDALAAGFLASPPPAESALAMLRTIATAGRSEPALAAALRKAAGLPENASIVPEYSTEAVASLVRSAQASGDATRGASWFRAPQAACLACHQIGSEGGSTGPNLTALGRGMTAELITESVLWPHRQIKEGYFLTAVTTKDGRIASGYLVREDNDTLVLRTPGSDATEHIAKTRISERSDSGSLMPDGLTSWMTEQQRIDLLRYLFDLGRNP
jgi:putative heme-binding domain-containing protein